MEKSCRNCLYHHISPLSELCISCGEGYKNWSQRKLEDCDVKG